MTDLDARLTRAGRDWRGSLDEGPRLEELFERGRRRRRPVLPVLPALAAAALVAALVLGALVVAQVSSRNPSARAAACQDQLTPQPTRFVNGAVTVRLTYTGSGVCRLDRYGPAAELTTTAGDHVDGYDTTLVGYVERYLQVRAGDMVTTTVTWNSQCQDGPDRGTGLVLHFDATTDPRTAGVHVPVPEPFAALCVPAGVPALAVTRVLAVPPPGTSTIAVRLGARYVGGPAPGHPAALVPATFTLLGDDPSTRASATSVAGRTVLLQVRPGRYQLHTVSGDAACTDRAVTVASPGPVSITVECSVK